MHKDTFVIEKISKCFFVLWYWVTVYYTLQYILLYLYALLIRYDNLFWLYCLFCPIFSVFIWIININNLIYCYKNVAYVSHVAWSICIVTLMIIGPVSSKFCWGDACERFHSMQWFLECYVVWIYMYTHACADICVYAHARMQAHTCTPRKLASRNFWKMQFQAQAVIISS